MMNRLMMTCGVVLFAATCVRAADVDFVRDVQPILKDRCVKCHGGDKPRGGLRLDVRDLAMEGSDSGVVIEPGKPESSDVIKRVTSDDSDKWMPPKGDRLTAEQVRVLRDWIAGGAVWPDAAAGSAVVDTDHWSFQPVRRTAPPAVKHADRVWNPIDSFVLARLEAKGMTLSPEADRLTLVRRLYLDLIGLPPTPEQADAFVNDQRPDAYERLVDELLASPHYGEHWARRWLDLARYADTNGYEKDRQRSMWPWRDWVINAYNSDMPFDRFTVEQIAGDMLPNPTNDQLIATGFHRNTMINEEGGVDLYEYRFHAMVDRVSTTATTWLGLTMACCQCHSHKYDPITQREYYKFMALMGNADEVDVDVPDAGVAKRRAEIERQIAAIESGLGAKLAAATLKPSGPLRWQTVAPVSATSAHSASLTVGDDGVVQAAGDNPPADTYTVVIDTPLADVRGLRLEALTQPDHAGPGRTPHGNFVLTDLKVTVAPVGDPARAKPVTLTNAAADFSQQKFDVAGAIDGDARSGWAVDDRSGTLAKDRSATFAFTQPVAFKGGTRLTITLDQQYGAHHTLGRFRLSLGTQPDIAPNIAPGADPARIVADKVDAWTRGVAPKCNNWTPVRPTSIVSTKPSTFEVQPDDSVLVGGFNPNNNTYTVELPVNLPRVTALRIEVLPDPSLPSNGPGRAMFDSVGPAGDFLLGEVEVYTRDGAAPVDAAQPDAGLARVPLHGATESFAQKGREASHTLDGKLDTGWSIKPRVGEAHHIVLQLDKPLDTAGGRRVVVKLYQQYIHQMCIGRFRISATADDGEVVSSGLPAEVESAIATPVAQRTDAQRDTIRDHYLRHEAPELDGERARIAKLRKSMPEYATSMVMRERAPEHARVTYLHHRGEYLKPKAAVEPGTPAVLHPMREGEPHNRLGLARWLVDPANPLVGRVVMNRQWQAIFGHGLVRTSEDFGHQGEPPTHPLLLDWLADEFVSGGWTLKRMHKLMVMSETYRQSSVVTDELLERDPENRLLSRAPRYRVGAETVRDVALSAAGLLSEKLGGPSVFPPQPASVTALSYGRLNWNTSTGEDRYRRGLYTFKKRTAPYAAFTTFDATSGEQCIVRRERSNTPLQALTTLNDAAFVEAAEAMARHAMRTPGDPPRRATWLMRRCLTRVPSADEVDTLVAFYTKQLARFRAGELNARQVAGDDAPKDVDVNDLAAWTATARVVLNLDETITRN
ncbi:MAG: DUF1549 domain-containing protein [Phycisphaera sp.]|nr:DUF1549 domain-containing protein [Phycisphaera sp.]